MIKKCSHLILFIFAGLTHLSDVIAGSFEFYVQQQHHRQPIPLHIQKSVKQYSFNQLIDHHDSSIGTFAQRYYLDETYGQKNNAPVFYVICGEGTCTKSDLDGAVRTYAQKFHAKLIALEHRYYGKSIPFNWLSSSSMRYLTTSAALEDLATFQKEMSSRNKWTGTWIAFGGSYPGSLAAYYRLKYPDLVAGALASSAPVMAKEDFFEYDTHVARVLGPVCTGKIQEVLTEIEAALADEHQLAQIKKRFNALNVVNPIDFLSLVADVGAIAVQYGNSKNFCTVLTSSKTALAGYAQATRDLLNEMHATAEEVTPQGFVSENPADYKNGGDGMRQWFYQLCTEYGYWQNANLDSSKSARSALINMDYQYQICQRLFNIKKPANIQATNKNFYFPLMNYSVSNIYFTNGENDPWSNLSMMVNNNNTTNPYLTYRLIKGASHCDDLSSPSSSDSKAMQLTRVRTKALIKEWLNN